MSDFPEMEYPRAEMESYSNLPLARLRSACLQKIYRSPSQPITRRMRPQWPRSSMSIQS